MEWITNSKLFKSSKYQNQILSAIQDPINKPLVQQLTSYVDEKYVEPEESVTLPDIDGPETLESKNSEDLEEPDGSKSYHPSVSRGANGHFDEPKTLDSKEIGDSPDLDDRDTPQSPSEDSDSNLPDSEVRNEASNFEESTKVNKPSIQSSTYVSVETVSQAVNEIPGTLNLREDTKGVTYVTLRGGSSNELWIYYDTTVDINKVLDEVNSVLVNSGYYFLEFNRVSRDDNAIVFSINWISSYFSPLIIKEENNEG